MIFIFTAAGETHDPEVYPRPDGTVYMCGYSDFITLPETADLVIPKEESVKSLHHMAGTISDTLKGIYHHSSGQ